MWNWTANQINSMAANHGIAFFLGFLLDLILGDPHWLPHPVRAIGWLTAKTEGWLRGNGTDGNEEKELQMGVWMVVIVLASTFFVAALLLFMAYRIHAYVGMAAEIIMTYQVLATKCLKVESMKVYHCLKTQTLDDARKAVSMIVGRDTQCLDEEGVAKAAIETVAENTSDGVIAPMLYMALGGPVSGLLYKAVNTMDSMVGYQNYRYLYFGRAAAKLDDVVNFLPARVSAYLMIGASFLGGSCFSGKRAFRIYQRDRRKHASPNSAQTEAVCAGALGIQLAGDASYFGKVVKKPHIGEAIRRTECEDIKRANRLMYLTAWMGQLLCLCMLLLMKEYVGKG